MNAERLTAALRNPKHSKTALLPYLVAGYPSRASFHELLLAVSEVADAVEVGVPFTDPMADGVSIQAASQAALKDGVNLGWILEVVADCPVPVALMGYLNPFLAYGASLQRDLEAAAIQALIVPDLPLEEQAMLPGIPLVQLVTPLTSVSRQAALSEASAGFVYAVTTRGVTGSEVALNPALAYLDRVRRGSGLPVMAGFGIRRPEQVDQLRDHCDGVIVGSALVQVLAQGGDPVGFLRQLLGA